MPHARPGSLARRRQRRARLSRPRRGCSRTAWRPPRSATCATPASSRTSEVVELREHAQDLTNHLLTGFPSPKLQAAIDAVLGADGLIAVSPIFSASYSGLFKLFFDVVERDGLAGTPTLHRGDRRHGPPLARPRARAPAAVRLPQRRDGRDRVYAAAEDWGAAGVAADGSLVERIDRAARASSRRRWRPASRGRGRDPFADPVPFEDARRAT